ncbi:ankyrin repeat-containing domain protein [Dichotomopilus funicola]|uniref:Ankyrin repeat-containing domain protein n=1 Tax=Dichotomopilus funicola TaxID=1934379 RepID=A0AAN6V962_9PEZI|nr:ankyrin repeat-containing domain protein [Dichotomopilus funicola]
MGSIVGPRSHNDYTIGWVCALPKEQAAAKAMLDAYHPTLGKPPGDNNKYILGSIGEHNIAITCLPIDQTGTIPAAIVAARMASTFPRIKLGLMVGIGGGVSREVRLGDVVIGTRVVQWDMGKAKEGGSFERTRALNIPPTALLSALSAMESARPLEGPKIFEYLAGLKGKWPNMDSKYFWSDSLEDVLFKASYAHVKTSAVDGNDKEKNCRRCDKTMVEKRDARGAQGAQMHYGLVASGNQVIKDAVFRDKLNKDLGGDVLCVEMEAAGLMNNFPCPTVAAATAKELLQYLSADVVEKEPAIKDLISEVRALGSKVGAVGADVTEMKSRMELDDEQKILEWLSPANYGLQQAKHMKTRQEGTGQWLLDSAKFKEWVETSQQTLFCPGMPGTGKTILTAVVIDSLASRFAHDPSVGIAYIYFNFLQQGETTAEELFASLLRQLAQHESPLPEGLRRLFDHHKGTRTRPSRGEILEVLHSVIRTRSRVFIAVDAIDECPETDQCRTTFVEGLLDLGGLGVNTFATSRFIPDVTDMFDKDNWLEIRVSDADVAGFVGAQISRAGSDFLKKVREEATAEIVKAAGGIFLLAKLDLDSLLDEKLPKGVRAALKTLPTGSKAYSGAYENAMKRIEHQRPAYAKVAKAVLLWIVCARRQLTLPELCHALAFDAGDSGIDLENVPEPRDLVSVCAGLVISDEQSGLVRLFHNTTREYFARTRARWFPTADDDIARACATYLSFNVFRSGPCPTDAELGERLRTYPLYDYAAKYWGHHARDALSLDTSVLDLLQSTPLSEASSQALLAVEGTGGSQRTTRVTGLHLAAYFGVDSAVPDLLGIYGRDPEDSHGRTPLSWAAENGRLAVVRRLLHLDADRQRADRSGWTPLYWAAQRGHRAVEELLRSEDTSALSPSVDDKKVLPATPDSSQTPALPAGEATVRLLIDKDVRTNLMDSQGQTALVQQAPRGSDAAVRLLLSCQGSNRAPRQTPLLWAAAGGHLAVVRQLLDTGAEAGSADDRGRTLLSLAAGNGHEEVVELLLEQGAPAESADDQGRTPLSWAAANGHKAVVRLLLDKGAKADSMDEEGWTPLLRAAAGKHVATVWLLVAEGANPDLAHLVLPTLLEDVRTLESWATENGNEAVSKSLPDTGENIDSINGKMVAMLAYAAEKGHANIVRILLDIGASTELPVGGQGTPLLLAAKSGHRAVVELLLERGANPDSSNSHGDTPLTWAATQGHEAVVKLLLKRGADLECRDKDGDTSLNCAVISGHEAIVKLLLEKGAALDSKNNNGSTPLFNAALRGHKAVTKLLLKRGADLELSDNHGNTPLARAVGMGHEEIAKLLLEKGAFLHSRNVAGDTPLLWAVACGQGTLVKLLLERGADLNSKNIHGITPLSCARREGHQAIVKLLQEKGATA